jgi:MFS family permease
VFSLGRKIDLSYKTNQLIVGLLLVIAAIGWSLTGEVLSGLYIGIGVFLTWALSRELDPKHEYSAFLAAAFSLINLLYYETIQLLVIVWLLLLMRIINGITGKALTTFDIFSVLGLTIYLSITNENSIYVMIYVLAMAFTMKSREKMKESLIAGGIGLIIFVVESLFMSYLMVNQIDYLNPLSIATLVIGFLSVVLFWFLSKEKTEDDGGQAIKRVKLLGSQWLYSAAVLLLFLFSNVSLNNLIIYLGVILGITIYFIGYDYSKQKTF